MPASCWVQTARERCSSQECPVWPRGNGSAEVSSVAAVLYACTAFLCYRAARVARLEAAYSSPSRHHPAFWLVLATLTLLLAVNRQFDLLPWLTQTGRAQAKARGWYGERRVLQSFVMIVVGAGCAGLLLGCCGYWLVRGVAPERIFALTGVLFILSFTVFKAMSYHEVDATLQQRIVGFKFSWLMEAGGIACFGVAAFLAGRRPPPVPAHERPETEGIDVELLRHVLRDGKR